MCGTQEPMGSGVPGGTHPNIKNMGSGRFPVPGKLGQSGFRCVSRSRSEPKKVGTPGFKAFSTYTCELSCCRGEILPFCKLNVISQTRKDLICETSNSRLNYTVCSSEFLSM